MFSPLQKDRKTGGPKIWMYKDKATDALKGEATITYEDAFAASSAIEWFGGMTRVRKYNILT